MNICQESNKNQNCRRENFRDSLLSKFVMKRIRLEKTLVWWVFKGNCSLAQSQVPPLAYCILSSISDFTLLKWS